MLPEAIKSGKEHVEDSIRDVDNEIAELNEEIQAKETDLAELNKRKTQFTQVKTALLAEKGKLEAVPK